jgi:hypothetical protein
VDYYRKGMKAMGLEDWNVAVEMFGMSVRFAPDVEGYQRLLLKCQDQQNSGQ